MTDLHIAIPPEGNSFGQRTVWRAREHVYPSRANPYALEAAAEFVWEHRSEIDLVLITGDVADDGIQRNLDAAYGYVTTPAADSWFTTPFAPTLNAKSGRAPPFVIMPGNHDRFRPAGRTPGGTAFDNTFSEYWQTGLGGVQSYRFEKEEGDTTVILLAADFCLKKLSDATVYLGQGYAYEDVITSLEVQTQMIRSAEPKAGVIWLSHFPPLLDVDHGLMLRHSERLLLAARRNGIRFIISGHLHRNQMNSYSDVDVICTGTASCMGAGELHGYWMQRLDVDVGPTGEVSIAPVRYRYRHQDSAFLKQ
ncbi:metallophosphoesterase family protein [Bradyrhizobium sp. DASA03076]|uniref:metallophosphoesterase family protein n=1 Tax=Bradyrhizobium sp. BLXBL-03 TaxID=3395916 RepID=UPI003F708BDD